MIRLFASGAAVGALILSAASLTSLTAHADPAAGTPPAATAGKPSPDAAAKGRPDVDWRAKRHAEHEAFFAAHLAALHAGLQLKPEQETLWAPVETAIRDLAHARGHHHHRDEADAGRTSTDALRQRSAQLIKLGNAMKGLADAADPLVASLNPEQKDRLPKLLGDLHPKHVLLRAFGVNGESREARGDEHEGHHWRHEAERGNDDRDGDGRHHEHGFHERGFEHHDHGRWAEGERDERGGGEMEWHHHRHHHHDEDGGDEPMHS